MKGGIKVNKKKQKKTKIPKLFIGHFTVWNCISVKIGPIRFLRLTSPFRGVRFITSGLLITGFLQFQMIHLVKELGKTALEIVVVLCYRRFCLFFNEKLSVAWAVYNGEVWKAGSHTFCIYLLWSSPQPQGRITFSHWK